jgi:hypothetical protein
LRQLVDAHNSVSDWIQKAGLESQFGNEHRLDEVDAGSSRSGSATVRSVEFPQAAFPPG